MIKDLELSDIDVVNYGDLMYEITEIREKCIKNANKLREVEKEIESYKKLIDTDDDNEIHNITSSGFSQSVGSNYNPFAATTPFHNSLFSPTGNGNFFDFDDNSSITPDNSITKESINEFIKSPVKPSLLEHDYLRNEDIFNSDTDDNTPKSPYKPAIIENDDDMEFSSSIIISENLNVIVSDEVLGTGAYGRVFLGFNTDTGVQVAVKEMRLGTIRDTKSLNTIREEIKLMQRLSHPKIVQYYGTISLPKIGLQIIMEYMSGKSVAHVLKLYGKLKEPVVKKYIRDTTEGLVYLHDNNVIHRDIKGANILLNEQGVAKLGDFGCSIKFEGVQSYTQGAMLGTVAWMAPEVIKQQERVGRKSDIWSLGCTVIEMFSGTHPWYEYNDAVQLITHV